MHDIQSLFKVICRRVCLCRAESMMNICTTFSAEIANHFQEFELFTALRKSVRFVKDSID